MQKLLSLEDTKSAVKPFVDFVKPTYGPASNKVIMTDNKVIAVLDDGVSIAEQYSSYDQYENAIIKLVLEVARRTNKRVGDGTTGSLILANALLQGMTEETDLKELKLGKDEAIEELQKLKQEVKSKDLLKQVAYMAYKNEKLAELVAEVVFKLGQDAVISLEETAQLETTYEFAEGIQFERGFMSPQMVTDTERGEAVWGDTPIIFTDRKIQSIQELVPVCEKLVATGLNRLVVIADDFLGDTIQTIVTNIQNKKFGILAIKAPGFAHRKRELLEDMAVATDGEVYSADSEVKFGDLKYGRAERVVASRDKTLIVNGAGTEEDIKKRIEALKEEAKNQQTDFDKARIQERIARLGTGVAIIKVGASTEAEMKAIKYKIEDAVNASKAALRSGVVRGGGQALKAIETKSKLLNKALREPERVLIENGGELEEVWDPVDVHIASLEGAVSIVSLLKEAKGIVVTE